MKLSISEAARRAGVERTTLYRKLEKGEISKEIGEDGKPVIDLSELARIYPQALDVRANVTGDTDKADSSAPQLVTSTETVALQRENDLLRQQVAALEADKADLRGERDRLLGVVEKQADVQAQATRLLTDQTTQLGLLGRFWRRPKG